MLDFEKYPELADKEGNNHLKKFISWNINKSRLFEVAIVEMYLSQNRQHDTMLVDYMDLISENQVL